MKVTKTYRATMEAEFVVEYTLDEDGDGEPDDLELHERAYEALFVSRDQWDSPLDLDIDWTLLHSTPDKKDELEGNE